MILAHITEEIGSIDLEEAFNNVSWKQMTEILKTAAFNYRRKKIIYNLYTKPGSRNRGQTRSVANVIK